MRRRLREILKNAHFISNGYERDNGEESGDDDVLEFEEDVIRLDYLDEVMLATTTMFLSSLARLRGWGPGTRLRELHRRTLRK